MIIVGLNLGVTRFGKELRDGGVCVLEDDNIRMIVAEERVCRQKRAGGYEAALNYSLAKLGLLPEDIDVVAYSSCCEPIRNDFIIRTNNTPQYLAINHHLSHAYSTYMLSPFEESLIMVIDAGGNTPEDRVNPEWWVSSREQHSYYVAKGNTITLLERDFDKPFSAGIAEIYRAFTYYLGWSSSQYAGKTMALAAYGDSERFSKKSIFTINTDGSIVSNIANNPLNPVSMVESILRSNGISGLKKRNPNEPIEQIHRDIAFWIQSETEKAILAKIDYLVKKTKIKKLCLSGGVAYNCTLNGKILLHAPVEDIFVHPGSGDHGQCLGNATYALLLHSKSSKRFVPFHPYWGGEEEITIKKVSETVGSDSKVDVVDSKHYITQAAELIANGNVICWFQGRSEYGPRALGNRSILADPRDRKVKDMLNKIKGREDFMPLAPSVLAEKASEYFDIRSNSPYMTYAVKVRPEMKRDISAVVHEDGTSRVHTVTEESNPVFYNLIKEFYKLTGIPMLLNTSFNKYGEPIVETLENALNSFLRMDINYLIARNFIIKKKENTTDTCMSNYSEFKIDFTTQDFNFERLKNLLEKEFPGRQLFPRANFSLYSEFVKWLESGRKTTTIRYRKGGIDLPKTQHLDVIETTDFGGEHSYNGKVSCAKIEKMVVKRFDMLNEEDARLDGFHNLQELKEAFNKIYGKIEADELVTIYHICLI